MVGSSSNKVAMLAKNFTGTKKSGSKESNDKARPVLRTPANKKTVVSSSPSKKALTDLRNYRVRTSSNESAARNMAATERKSSITAEELTPIVLSQLQNANKLKEESRKLRRAAAAGSSGGGGGGGGSSGNANRLAGNGVIDSGSESCGEETRKKTAEAFMSGIQSALGASLPAAAVSDNAANNNNQTAAAADGSGLSSELVSEVDLVLSKLMSSVNKGDPKLVPLIASLQSSLKATVESPTTARQAPNIPNNKLQLSKASSLTSPTSPRTPSTPSTAGSSHKEWMRDPFGALPKRPPQQAQSLEGQDVEAGQVKTFDPVPLSEFSRLEDNDGAVEDVDGSKVPWKIRAARKRMMKHHTTGMTKDEFAKIKQSLQESAVKFSPSSNESYPLSRNKSESSVRHHLNQQQQQLQQPPQANQQLETKTDLGYASDICDYNVPKSDGSNNRHNSEQSRRPDTSYVSQKRPVSMVSPNLKPQSPLLESSLYSRRRRLIEGRAKIFGSSVSLSQDYADCTDNTNNNNHLLANNPPLVEVQPPSPLEPKTEHLQLQINVNPAYIPVPGPDPKLDNHMMPSSFQQSGEQQQQQQQDNPHVLLSLPDNEKGSLSQQSSLEEDKDGNQSSGGGGRVSRKNSRASSSGVRAKIARRKMMRQANSMDNPQGSLSDQEANSEVNEDEDSVEEKQDSEPINEKENKYGELEVPQQANLSQLTPDMARKNWSSRFSNIKNSFDAPSEDDSSSKSRSPSINRQYAVEVAVPPAKEEAKRGRDRERAGNGGSNGRSRSAHNIKTGGGGGNSLMERTAERAQSKEDKNKMNKLTASNNSTSRGYISDNPVHHHPNVVQYQAQQPSGRDSVDYHQYLEMIERFRGNNPKAYSRPLQKNVPTVPNSKVQKREYVPPPPPTNQRQTKSQPREQNYDPQTRKAEILGLVRAANQQEAAKTKDMDYQEYMNIINKVRKTKEFTRVRTEQFRLASMYAQEKKRQEELKLEEERLRTEREKIEREHNEARMQPLPAISRNNSIDASMRQGSFEKGELDNKESELAKVSPNLASAGRNFSQDSNHSVPEFRINPAGETQEQLRARQEQARLEQIKLEQMEQKRQQELRELQVKAEQERLVKLKEEQMKQEKEREEIRRLEYERLQQIQEEQQRLEFERMRQEQNIRQEQQRLEEERKRQEKLQAEKNAQYNKQRLDIEAQNFAMNEDQRLRERMRSGQQDLDAGNPTSAMTDEERLMRERFLQQEKLREVHKKEEAQIRKEKMNLIQQEQNLISRQEEMLLQIEDERINLAKQEDLIRSRQEGRLQHVRQEKQILEKQEEMLKMREQQLEQERIRQDRLRNEQKALREQEEAIKRRQEEIKELLMSDLSDTGSESITMCQPREGQVFLGKKTSTSLYPEPSLMLPQANPSLLNPFPGTTTTQVPLGPEPYTAPGGEQVPLPSGSETDEDTLDEDDDEDYYETKVEVKQNSTSVPKSVRTIETKIDNPPWAPITPYLNIADRQNQDELSAILKGHPFTKSGVVTSPESIRTSANLITTPESSLQSQISQADSVSSSCPGSPPPPVPPLPIDAPPKAMTAMSVISQGGSFLPVQPDIPPRDDSFGVAAVYTTNSDMIPSSILTDSAGQSRRSLVEPQETHDTGHSPRIGGPGSAFKPYASSENLFDPTLYTKKSPDISSQKAPIFSVSGSSSSSGPIRNGYLGKRDIRQPVYSKVRELRQQVHAPFSTTDTEPEMKECNLPAPDTRKRGKAKAPVYSTSETEEEYQNYLRMRPKWHGKGGHKDSWDPLQIESPPQITQKPVGIIQKPKAQAPMVVERGTQIGQTPVFVPDSNVPQKAYQQQAKDVQNGSLAPPMFERIQKSDSIIEMKRRAPSQEQRPPQAQNQVQQPVQQPIQQSVQQPVQQSQQQLGQQAPQNLPHSVVELNRQASNEAEENGSMIPWVKIPQQTSQEKAPFQGALQKSDQIKTMQEKYLENLNAGSNQPPSYVSPQVDAHTKKQKELHQKLMGETVQKVEQKKQEMPGQKKNFNIMRTNPTIAAMEIMTRKEMKINEMEERMAREHGLGPFAKLVPGKSNQPQQAQGQIKKDPNEQNQHSLQEKAKLQQEEQRQRQLQAQKQQQEQQRQVQLQQMQQQEQQRLQQEKLEQERKIQQQRAEQERKIQQQKAEEDRRLREQKAEEERRVQQQRLEQERKLQQQKQEEERTRQENARRLQQEQEMKLKHDQERRLQQQKLEEEQRLYQQKLEQERIQQEKQEQQQRLKQKQLEEEKRKQEKFEEELRIQQERLEQERIQHEKLEMERKRQLEELQRQREIKMKEEEAILQKKEQEKAEQEKQRWLKQQQEKLKQQQLRQEQQKKPISNSQLVVKNPMMAKKEPSPRLGERKISQEDTPPMIVLKKQPKILGPEEIKARKNSSENKDKSPGLASKKSPVLKKKKLVAEVKPQAAAVKNTGGFEEMMTNESVKRAAERFEHASRMEKENMPVSGMRARSKSIGSNLYQKLLELEEDKGRIKESLTQTKSILPWTGQGGEQGMNKAPVLRKRDSFFRKDAGYELRTSKSSDSITAAKMLAEARMQGRQGGGGLRINQNMSKSIEKQIDVYTKPIDDIRKILQLAKTCSVNDRIKLFNTQKPEEPERDDVERELKAEAIRREIEEAKAQKANEKVSDEEVEIQKPVEYKVKPLKIPMKPKLIKTSPNNSLDRDTRGVPGKKLRINQPAGKEHKSEIRSILKKSRENLLDEGLDDEEIKDERRLSIEDLPSVKSKISTYLKQAEEDSKVAPPSSDSIAKPKSILVKHRTASLDRKKAPRLLETLEGNEDRDTFQIYAQSATDYSATEDDDEDHHHHHRGRDHSRVMLEVPKNNPLLQGIKKSKSFAGQFEGSIDASEVDEKQKTMLAFFGGKESKGQTQPPPTMQDKRPLQQVIRQTSITSIMSDDIIGADEDLRDVDAVFESLLNNTFEDADTKGSSSSRGAGASSNPGKGSSGKGGQGGGGGRERASGLNKPHQLKSESEMNKSAVVRLAQGEEGVFGGRGNAKGGVTRQQTWAGPQDATPLSPSPTLSEYDTCGGDPWDDY